MIDDVIWIPDSGSFEKKRQEYMSSFNAKIEIRVTQPYKHVKAVTVCTVYV